LAMANSGPDTNGSQFFVTVGPQLGLDLRFTLFGQLVRGFDVLQKINSVPTDASQKPLSPVVITSAAIISDPADTVLTVKALPGATSANFTITANDGHGGIGTRDFAASIAPNLLPERPFLNPLQPSYTTPVNTPFNLALTAVNPDAQAIVFAAQALGSTPHATVNVSGNQL